MLMPLTPKRSLFSFHRKRAPKLPKFLRNKFNRTTHCIIPLLDETRPGRPLPKLPPELWSAILREATLTRYDAISTCSTVSFLDTHEHLEQDYRQSMRTKVSISLVCHSWHRFVTEFLYEFVWISRAKDARLLAQTLVGTSKQLGYHIRRLHIETPSLERCDPSDLRTIIDHSPCIVIYSDQRSVRRGHWEAGSDPLSTSERLLEILTRPNNRLRRLSWTTYNTDPCFPLHMVPMLEATASQLEYLELTVCCPTTSSLSTHPIPSASNASSLNLACSYISLPNLRSLKLTLDDTTFSTIKDWNLPMLTRLSVVSADFAYAGVGFSGFLSVHGSKLTQLELGHSSTIIEEHYLTAPPSQPTTPIGNWCPNLKEFICSADAEWNWQSPDWVAPHLLLPHHPNLTFIGIKNMDKRLSDDVHMFPSNDSADDSPFFLLATQMSSMLNPAAFPNLRYIRDLSFESHLMRSVHPEERITKFWTKVLEKCKERDVWLEDYGGYNVTASSLKRAKFRIAP